jgi:HSP20 family molecular chaperone IbpA
MVEASPHTNADWWPNIADPLRRFGAKVSEYFTPASDAATTDDAYIVEVELPGVKDEDISVQMHGNMLIVKGNKHSSHEEKDKTYHFFGANLWRLSADFSTALGYRRQWHRGRSIGRCADIAHSQA